VLQQRPTLQASGCRSTNAAETGARADSPACNGSILRSRNWAVNHLPRSSMGEEWGEICKITYIRSILVIWSLGGKKRREGRKLNRQTPCCRSSGTAATTTQRRCRSFWRVADGMLGERASQQQPLIRGIELHVEEIEGSAPLTRRVNDRLEHNQTSLGHRHHPRAAAVSSGKGWWSGAVLGPGQHDRLVVGSCGAR